MSRTTQKGDQPQILFQLSDFRFGKYAVAAVQGDVYLCAHPNHP